MIRVNTSLFALISILFCGLSVSCASNKQEPDKLTQPLCDDSLKDKDGQCPGLTIRSNAISACRKEVSCTKEISISAEQLLSELEKKPAAGTCFLLTGGTGPYVEVPAGVHLLGLGADQVTLKGVATTSGEVTVCGVSLAQEGVSVSEEAHLTLLHAKFQKSANVAAQNYGKLTIRSTSFEELQGNAIYAGCSTPCAKRPQVELDSVFVKQAQGPALWFSGADVKLYRVHVEETFPKNFVFARGIEFSNDTVAKADYIEVLNNNELGILVDHSSVELNQVIAKKNLRGVQIQGTGIRKQGVTLKNFEIIDNKGVGLGIHKEAKGLIIQGGRIASTLLETLIADSGDVVSGDGINWLGGSEATISNDVIIENNQREALVIDPLSRGSFQGKIQGKDASKGLIIQGGLQPSTLDNLKLPEGITKRFDAIVTGAAVKPGSKL